MNRPIASSAPLDIRLAGISRGSEWENETSPYVQ